MRERIYEILEKSEKDDIPSLAYDIFMIVVIFASLLPLLFKEEYLAFVVIDKTAMVIFIIDYILRWMTADYKFGKKGAWSFIRYPLSPMAIVDFVSILPSLSVINNGFKVLRVLRMIRAFRVFRVLKIVRYSKRFRIIGNVIRKSRKSLMAVAILAVGYILVSALVIFNVEPDSFDNFFEAVYWATVSLTTVGYGDIYPVSTLGRIITMLSSLFGIAIVALPSGILTAGYMTELQKADDEEDDEETVERYDKYSVSANAEKKSE